MKIIPFGNRILVRRRKTGGKVGSIHLPDQTSERPTDLATVVNIPDHTFCDKQLLEKSDEIIESITKKAIGGDSDALNALLEYNIYLKIKTIQVGDAVMIGKYVGTDFHDNKGGESLTLVLGEDIIGLVVKDE